MPQLLRKEIKPPCRGSIWEMRLCWRQGCTHTSCPCTALLPVKPPTPSSLLLPPFTWQKGLLPLSRPRDLHWSLPIPSSSPLLTSGSSHSLFLMPWALITHIRALLGNVRLSKPCLIHFHKAISQTSDPAAEKCPADKKGCLTNKLDWVDWIRNLPHVHHQSITTSCCHNHPLSSLPQTKMNQLLLF